MKMTVSNLSSTVTLNALITGGNGVSPDAVGGSRSNPLPYPFAHVTLAPSASLQLPMHLEDFRYKSVPWLPLEPSREWARLIQQGVVSVSYTNDTLDTGDAEGHMASTLA